MRENEIMNWLLEGDVAIQYQVHRDLLHSEVPELRGRIANEGWGLQFLSLRNENGHWGRGFYQPKWTSTHYTLLDLKSLGISPENQAIRQTISLLIQNHKGLDGGMNPSRLIKNSDVCINGMFLNYAAYFKTDESDLQSIIDFLISEQMPDGGFNCRSNRSGAVHSSLHTTLSVLEGILEYTNNDYRYRLSELKKAEQESREFILHHKLFQSHRTGVIIDPKMLMLSFPSRWRYDILRALDYFQFARVEYDARMAPAIDILLKKKLADNRWPLQARHHGLRHFDMERTGKPSRWNTLRALRVLKYFGITY
ncbi:hypothetical protein JW964_18080 [candidate division KSB1 bacterium]|nr:hypothetical protein [candidate division KSB1 bacterium]